MFSSQQFLPFGLLRLYLKLFDFRNVFLCYVALSLGFHPLVSDILSPVFRHAAVRLSSVKAPHDPQAAAEASLDPPPPPPPAASDGILACCHLSRGRSRCRCRQTGFLPPLQSSAHFLLLDLVAPAPPRTASTEMQCTHPPRRQQSSLGALPVDEIEARRDSPLTDM